MTRRIDALEELLDDYRSCRRIAIAAGGELVDLRAELEKVRADVAGLKDDCKRYKHMAEEAARSAEGCKTIADRDHYAAGWLLRSLDYQETDEALAAKDQERSTLENAITERREALGLAVASLNAIGGLGVALGGVPEK